MTTWTTRDPSKSRTQPNKLIPSSFSPTTALQTHSHPSSTDHRRRLSSHSYDGQKNQARAPALHHITKPKSTDDFSQSQLSEEQLKRSTSYWPNIFERIICDEAQRLKSQRTQTHQAVKFLNAPIMNFFTGTLANIRHSVRTYWSVGVRSSDPSLNQVHAYLNIILFV